MAKLNSRSNVFYVCPELLLCDRSFPAEIELIAVEPGELQFPVASSCPMTLKKKCPRAFPLRLEILRVHGVGNLKEMLTQIRLPRCAHQLEEFGLAPASSST